MGTLVGFHAVAPACLAPRLRSGEGELRLVLLPLRLAQLLVQPTARTGHGLPLPGDLLARGGGGAGGGGAGAGGAGACWVLKNSLMTL